MVGDPCPANSELVAKAYLNGTLPEDQKAAFEEHYIGCPKCGERLQFTEAFILAVRNAAARLSPVRL